MVGTTAITILILLFMLGALAFSAIPEDES